MIKFLNLVLAGALLFLGDFTAGYAQEFNTAQKAFISNLVTNPGAEVGITGVRAYKDAAAAIPEDGTGGSPTVTCTVSSSSPLFGSRSFVLTKDAASRIGEGCSVDITIPAGLQTQVLRAIYLKSTSANFVDGDVRMYAFDVTGGATPPELDTRDVAAGSSDYVGSLQVPSGSATIRLIFHVASTSALAYTLKWDDLFVGRKDAVRAPTLLGPVTFTPTSYMSAGFGTVTPLYGEYVRVGDRAKFKVGVNAGTVAATAASFTLPNGLVLKSTTNRPIGKWHRRASAENAFGDIVANTSAGSNVVYFSYGLAVSAASGGPGSPFNTANVNDFLGTGNDLDFEFEVAIAGWDSNTTSVAEDGGGRLITLRAVRSTNQTVSTTSATQIAYNTAGYDPLGMLNTSTGDITIPEGGYYFLQMQTQPQSLAASDNYISRLRKNASTELATENIPVLVTDNNQTHSIVTLQFLNKGDVISGWTDSGSDSSYTVNGTTAPDVTFLSLFKLPSPIILGGGETVAVSALQTSATSLPNTGNTDISWDSTKTYDTHNALSGTTFTAPSSGKYRSCSRLKLSNVSWTSGNSYAMSIFKNGSVHKYLMDSQIAATASVELNLAGCADVSLVKGDTLKINVSHNRTGGAVSITNSTTQNYWDIIRVGN